MTFAIERFRCRKSPSGMSGALVRDSIAMKLAKIVAARPSRPSVCGDVQPASLPFTIA